MVVAGKRKKLEIHSLGHKVFQQSLFARKIKHVRNIQQSYVIYYNRLTNQVMKNTKLLARIKYCSLFQTQMYNSKTFIQITIHVVFFLSKQLAILLRAYKHKVTRTLRLGPKKKGGGGPCFVLAPLLWEKNKSHQLNVERSSNSFDG